MADGVAGVGVVTGSWDEEAAPVEVEGSSSDLVLSSFLSFISN